MGVVRDIAKDDAEIFHVLELADSDGVFWCWQDQGEDVEPVSTPCELAQDVLSPVSGGSREEDPFLLFLRLLHWNVGSLLASISCSRESRGC